MRHKKGKVLMCKVTKALSNINHHVKISYDTQNIYPPHITRKKLKNENGHSNK
jgi:hypothetical protein